VSLWPSKQRNGTTSGAFARSLEPKLGTISNYQTVSSPIASADPRRNGRWQIGAGYRHALEWSQRVRWPYVEEEYHPVLNEYAD
jgi:hypothetical protein